MHIPATNIIDINELVVNWHVLEACNFSCQFCFAKWDERGMFLAKDPVRAEKLIEALYGLFAPANARNPLRPGVAYSSLRLTVAGGEPTLLGERLIHILAHATATGFRTALITNGSRPDIAVQAARYVDTLSISVDSIDRQTNRLIGRHDAKGNVLECDDLIDLVRRIRRLRPQTRIKINTVVNEANAGEDLSAFITAVAPDRWKIMRTLPIVTEALMIDHASFVRFVERHQVLRSLMTVEDNSDMVDSYIMVDQFGRFYQNSSTSAGYVYSRPILDVGADAAFKEIAFDPAKFASRYTTLPARGRR